MPHAKEPAVEHVAIDLGGRESQICVRASDGTILDERKWATAALDEYLATRPPSRVIVETTTGAFRVADRARALGHEVRVVPATLVPALGVGSRRTKNDRRDAQLLSESSCRMDLPSVHIPTAAARERKLVCTMREGLVAIRTQLINGLRAWMRSDARRVRAGAAETFAARLRECCEAPLASYVERHLVSLECVNEQIRQADKELAAMAKKDELCRRLMTVPSVGPVTAVRFAAAIDDVGRFRSAHALESYVGLVPGEWSSSERERRLGITKAGPGALRRTLFQAAWSLRIRGERTPRAVPLARWAQQIELRRGKHIATVALARKLAGILFAIYRDGSSYDPLRAATMT